MTRTIVLCVCLGFVLLACPESLRAELTLRLEGPRLWSPDGIETRHVLRARHYAGSIIQPDHVTQAELTQATVEFYRAWKSKYLRTVKGTDPVQKYVYYSLDSTPTPANAISTSESHGHGMLLTALLAGFDSSARADFDALYRFCRAHPSQYSPDLMAWQQLGSNGTITPFETTSATDGDMDIAYALLLADKQWGSNQIDYRGHALSIIRATMDQVVNQSEWILMLGDWVKRSSSIAKFGCSTRPSDFMPGHLRAFAAVDTANSAKWTNVIGKIVEIVKAQHTTGGSLRTGLMPDFEKKDKTGRYAPVKGVFLESKEDGDYSYNSCRTPWRLAVDYILTGDDSLVPQLTVLNTWIKSTTGGDPRKIHPGYYVGNGPNGTPIKRVLSDGEPNLPFMAPLMVSAMISSENQAWVNALWDSLQSHSIDTNVYYGNTLKLLAMVVASGLWR